MFKKPYNKYGNKKVEIDGIRFDSTKESKRYLELKQMQEDGNIMDLEVHPKYELLKKFYSHDNELIRAIHYEADFTYLDVVSDEIVVEDVKPLVKKTGKFWMTAEAKIKIKWFKFKYPLIKFKLV